MKNFGGDEYETGFDTGYEEGYDAGYEEGFNEGLRVMEDKMRWVLVESTAYMAGYKQALEDRILMDYPPDSQF